MIWNSIFWNSYLLPLSFDGWSVPVLAPSAQTGLSCNVLWLPQAEVFNWTARSHWHCILLKTHCTEDNSWPHGVLSAKLLQKSLCRILKLQVSLCCFVLNNHWFVYMKLFCSSAGFFSMLFSMWWIQIYIDTSGLHRFALETATRQVQDHVFIPTENYSGEILLVPVTL